MSFYFLFRNQINNYALSQEQKFGKNQSMNDENWKLGVITVMFKFSLVCKKKLENLVIADGTNCLVKIM